jgi:AbrB family transcriptional regulator (stage V sporulation protein T)
MKSTGIVRKIDSLGRIVIPKEIRNNMHIKVGDDLEIYINSNEDIILRKFSNIGNVSLLAKDIVSAINSIINENVIITDNERVIAVSGYMKDLINKNISDEYSKLINERKQIIVKNMVDIKLIDEEIKGSYGMVPIIVNGQLIGSIVILSENRSIRESEFDILKVISSFFTKYLEE